jgi:uncharacterized membrane protein
METPDILISSPIGVLAVLVSVAAFFFALAQYTKAKFFDYVPPLLFIYATPVLLNTFGVIPTQSIIYGGLSQYALPAFIVLMLIKVNVPAVVKVMGKGLLVMFMGTAGVFVGGVIAYLAVSPWLSDGTWKAVGALAGSWIGGTANMAAAGEMLGATGDHMGLAIIADNLVYIVWLPLLLISRDYADQFNRWARVPADRIAAMDAAADLHMEEDQVPTMPHYLYLAAIVIGITWFGNGLSPIISEWIVAHVHEQIAPAFGASTIRVLLVTTLALALSTTRVSTLPNSTAIGTALVYIFVAGMGARASLAGLGSDAPVFVAGAFIWITIHGLFCIAGAWIFRVDIHSVAIASAANIGAAASAPIVAAHHRPNLVPVSILMALIGYALGNYIAPAVGYAAKYFAGQ